MTNQPNFAEAARAEAEAVMGEARERIGITVQEQTRYVEGYVACAEWARDHLAAQEPTAADTGTLAEKIRDEVAGIIIGSGYYSTAIGIDEAAEVAAAVLPIVEAEVRKAKAEAWAEGARAALTELAVWLRVPGVSGPLVTEKDVLMFARYQYPEETDR